jgi:hypothetical protein
MRRIATLLSVTLIFLLFPGSAFGQWQTEWSFIGEARPAWFGVSTERNIAYGVVNDAERLYVASRSGGAFTIRALNPNTGLEVPGVVISTAGITGGTLPFNTIDVSDDGMIIVSSLAVSTSEGDPFKVYLWTSEDAQPANIITHTTGGYRLGDNIDISGSVSDGTAVIYVAAGTNPAVLRWTMVADPENPGQYIFSPTPTVYDPLANMPSWGTPAWAIGKEAGANSRFLAGGRSNVFMREYRPDGTTSGFIEWPGTTFNRNVGSGEYFSVGDRAFLATYHPTLRQSNIFEINEDAADGVFANKYLPPPYGPTPQTGAVTENTLGDLSYRLNDDGTVTLFLLATNNGIAAYTTTDSFLPSVFTVELTGRAGWRMLSSPVAGATYEELLDGIWTQGFPGAGSEAGEPNVVLYSEPARAWQPPSGIDAVIGASEGFIAYVYEFDLPATLSVSGAENAEVLERMLSYTETGDLGERGWNLVGNPFTQAIEVGGLGLQDNADVSNFVYIWDPNAGASGDYVAINAADAPQTAIAAFQGFWVKANADGQTFDIPETAKTTGGTFYGRPVASTEPAPRIGLTLSHEASSSQAFITFREDGLMGVDANDGFLPASLGTEYVRIYSALEGIGRFMYQNLPQALSGVVSIPVGVQATSGGTFELSWTLPADFGTAWQVALIDSQTGAEVDMRATSSYSFTADASPEGAERFSVEITTSGVSSEDGAGRFAFTLHGVYPNPAAGQATVAFELASAGEASVAVYDVMGRRVAVLSEGEHAAGRHEVSLDGTSLASGIYVVRVTAGEHVASERFTLVR